MPVSLGSLTGVDARTAQALMQLAQAINRLEARLDVPIRVVADPALVAGLKTAEQQIQALLARVAALEAAP